MIEGLARAIEILREEPTCNYEEELLIEDLIMRLKDEIMYKKLKDLNSK